MTMNMRQLIRGLRPIRSKWGPIPSIQSLGNRRWSSDWKRLKPDPNRVPNTRPPESKEAPAKNQLEAWRLYDQTTPTNNISSVTADGFVLESGARVVSTAEKPLGLMLVGGEAFEVDLRDAITGLKLGRVELDGPRLFGLFEILHPRPDLLVVGMGGKSRIVGPTTAAYLRSLGLQTDVATTRTSASNFDLLASERGGRTIAGFLLPPNM